MNFMTPDKTLKCPHCGSDYLHQETVAVFNRPEEDSTVGLAMTITGQTVQPASMQENPSPRRNGLSIDFSCETCSTDSTLNIWQHKGQTMVNWAAVG